MANHPPTPPITKTLRKYCQENGITAEALEMPIATAIEEAAKHPDPRRWLDDQLMRVPPDNGEAIDDARADDVPNATDPNAPEPADNTEPAAAETITIGIEVPVGPPPARGGHVGTRIDIPHRHLDCQLTRPQGRLLRRVRDALHQQGQLLRNGNNIRTNNDAIRWLLEQIDDEVAAESSA
ncbi:MAG TPA: hypothetical protein VMY35_05315 [Phycisphaerae bacterium]|nr:hypothetical protein [Phycisphaerae bacterium]